jgi:hypothetical protein
MDHDEDGVLNYRRKEGKKIGRRIIMAPGDRQEECPAIQRVPKLMGLLVFDAD